MKNLSGSLSKPKRNFCAGGPIPKEGYYVLRDRPEISEIIDKVEKGRYFVIYAPRQVGKTSLIQEVVQKLSDDSEYLPLYLTFQNFDQKINKEDFYRELARTLLFEIQISLKNKNVENLIEVDESEIYSQLSFTKFMETLHGQIPHHLCLFIDEFEDIPKDVLDGFLRTLRGIYLKKQRDENYNILHSMGVIGVRSISQMTFARTSSPFNIHESISISNFTTEQVKELLMQYSKETGEVFSEEVIEFIADKTGGQPYLVNLVAKILTTEIKPYTENRPITIPNTENAYMKMLTMRGNSNLDSIRKRIRDANNRKRLMSIITRGNVRYNVNDEILEELITFGIIQEKDGYCIISNPAYAHAIIYSYMPWNNGTPEEFFPDGYQPVIDSDGFIKPHPVIENFQYFLPKVDPKFYFPEETGFDTLRYSTQALEIVPHYFLLGQFDILAYYVGGHARAEVHQGHKRMDIVVFEKGGRKTVIECKIWRGVAYQQEAREQVVDYLIHEGLSLGYLVFFAQSQKASYSFSKVEVFGKTVCEYIIPLPERLSNTFSTGFKS